MKPFVPVEHEGFEYIAVILNGFQIGALARTPDGQYVQANGDVLQPLDEYKVVRALRSRGASRSVTSPTVSLRRRRSIDDAERFLNCAPAIQRCSTQIGSGRGRKRFCCD